MLLKNKDSQKQEHVKSPETKTLAYGEIKSDKLVLIDKPISTGFMLGIGIQLSFLLFLPFMICVSVAIIAIFGAL